MLARYATVKARLGEWLPQGSFAHHVGIMAGGAAAAQALAVLIAPLLSRIYTPAEFGVLGVYVSIITVLQVVAMLGYHGAIPLPKDDDEVLALVVLSGAVLVSVSALLGVAMLFAGPLIVALTEAPVLASYLWVFPAGLLLVGGFEILTIWAVRNKLFSTLARIRISQGVAMAVVMLGLGLAHVGVLGLILGELAGRSLGILTLLRSIRRVQGGRLRQVTLRRLRSTLARYRRFPQFLMPFLLFNRTGLQIPAVLFIAFYNPAVAGLVLLGEKVVQLPMAFIGRSVARVYLGEAAEVVRQHPGRLGGLYRKTFKGLCLIGIGPMAVIIVAAPLLFGTIFGESWREAGHFVSLLAVPILLQFATSPLSQTFAIIERQDLAMFWAILRLVLVAGGISLAGGLGLAPVWAVSFYAIANTLSYATLYLILDFVVPLEVEAGGPAARACPPSSGAEPEAPHRPRAPGRTCKSPGG